MNSPKRHENGRVGTIVACRLKSSRLPRKGLLPIAGVPSVERCLNNCLLFKGVGVTVLATSSLPEDAELEDHVLGGRMAFWRGDPDDVIKRYIGACDKFGINVVVRVTADCPVVSPEITEYLLRQHFQSRADYTASRECAVGSGSEIYSADALRRVIALMGEASHSEYMTWYLRNNPDVFKVNIVNLPPQYVRSYRLTLDYPEDLQMFERLYSLLEERGLEPTLTNVFSILDAHPDIPRLNDGLTLCYRTDQNLIEMLNRVTRIHIQSSET